MRRGLEYYMKLNYPVVIYKIPDEEGGGYIAYIEELGKHVFTGSGDTIEEAMQHLESIKKEMFQYYIDSGEYLPEPKQDSAHVFSGRLTLRIPKTLHRELATRASLNDMSMNSYINYLLSTNYVFDQILCNQEKCHKI